MGGVEVRRNRKGERKITEGLKRGSANQLWVYRFG